MRDCTLYHSLTLSLSKGEGQCLDDQHAVAEEVEAVLLPHDLAACCVHGSDLRAAVTQPHDPKLLWGDERLLRQEFGAVRRQDAASASMLQAWSWHDDRTRVRIFGQQTENGPRLYSEWREWPIPAVKR